MALHTHWLPDPVETQDIAAVLAHKTEEIGPMIFDGTSFDHQKIEVMNSQAL
jgi:hypothetical protein